MQSAQHLARPPRMPPYWVLPEGRMNENDQTWEAQAGRQAGSRRCLGTLAVVRLGRADCDRDRAAVARSHRRRRTRAPPVGEDWSGPSRRRLLAARACRVRARGGGLPNRDLLGRSSWWSGDGASGGTTRAHRCGKTPDTMRSAEMRKRRSETFADDLPQGRACPALFHPELTRQAWMATAAPCPCQAGGKLRSTERAAAAHGHRERPPIWARTG